MIILPVTAGFRTGGLSAATVMAAQICQTSEGDGEDGGALQMRLFISCASVDFDKNDMSIKKVQSG